MHIYLIQFESNYKTDHRMDRPINYYRYYVHNSVVLHVTYFIIYNDVILDLNMCIQF